MAHSIKRIRTIALVGQSGSGKTALAEALLAKAGAIPAAGSVERGTTVGDYTPLEKQLQHSLKLAVASFDFQETQSSSAGHAGLPRLPRPRPARARRGRDRRGGDQRAERHRDDDRPLPAGGGEARPRPADRGEQDRRRQRRPARTCSSASRKRSARNACRSTCRPGDAQQGLRLLLRALGRGRFQLGGGSAPEAHRPGGRGRREADGEVPREGRGEPRRAARAARARAARRPPDPGGVRLGEDRRRHRRAARRDRQAAAQPDRGQSALLLGHQGGNGAAPASCSRCPIPASTCSRTCSRSRSIPTSAASPCSACTRAA